MPFKGVFNESVLELAKIEVQHIMQVLNVPEEKALLYLVACAEARLLAEERQRTRWWSEWKGWLKKVLSYALGQLKSQE